MVTLSAAWLSAILNVSLWEKVEPLYHHLIPFQTYSDWIDFEPAWIIYEIAGNYIIRL